MLVFCEATYILRNIASHIAMITTTARVGKTAESSGSRKSPFCSMIFLLPRNDNLLSVTSGRLFLCFLNLCLLDEIEEYYLVAR